MCFLFTTARACPVYVNDYEVYIFRGVEWMEIIPEMGLKYSSGRTLFYKCKLGLSKVNKTCGFITNVVIYAHRSQQAITAFEK